jgi:hypothetical protein
MKIVKRTAVVVAISGLLMSAASVSTWAGMPSGNIPAPSHLQVLAAANGPLFATESSLEPSMALQAARQVRSNCEASHMYGADNVVGDKNACIMGGYAIPGGYGSGVAVGGVGMASGVR